MRSKRLVYLLLVSAIFLLFMSVACERSIDNPVALVNGQAISRKDLNNFVGVMRLCSADLDSALEKGRDGFRQSQLESELLQILIDYELVRQELERLSLEVDATEWNEKTGQLIDELIKNRFHGSPDALHRRCRQLHLELDDLSIIPLYELQLVLLFEYVAGLITGEDLRLYVEENPELLMQGEAWELYCFIFENLVDAQAALEKLDLGLEPEQLADRIGNEGITVGVDGQGWVTQDDSFLDRDLRQELFTIKEANRGWIREAGDAVGLFWIAGYRPDTPLDFSNIDEEAALRIHYDLYQDYFNKLWSESQIEVIAW